MDLLAVKENRTMFIEVKQEQGKLSEIQKYRLNELRSKNIEAYVWISYNENYDKGDPYSYQP
jgi:Holliday junction resolvase-like predicted endonuclease